MTRDISIEPQPTRRQMPGATIAIAIMLCLYWAVLFYGTHMPLPPGLLPGNSDKFVHFGSYALLGVLLMSLRATRGPYRWFSVIARWVVLGCYGAFDELTQLLVNRSADIHDWYADVLGAAVGLGLVTFFVWMSSNSPQISKDSRVTADGADVANAVAN